MKRWISKQRLKHLGILLIFTPIPLTPKKCGLSIGYKGRIWEWLTLTYTISQWCCTYIKFCTFFPLYLTNYLIGLTFWVFPIGLKCVAWSERGGATVGSVGNMHIRSGKLNGSTSFTIYNMHYVNFEIQV